MVAEAERTKIGHSSRRPEYAPIEEEKNPDSLKRFKFALKLGSIIGITIDHMNDLNVSFLGTRSVTLTEF